MNGTTTSTHDGLSRVERKRQAARRRIIEAAESLMIDHPVDEVTIADITRAADVGHGSFYLHFESKYDVLTAIVRARAAAWDERSRASVGERDDPAEALSLIARLMAHAALDDPLWRWYLTHSGVPIDDMRDAIGRFAAADFAAGLETGRFRVPDLETCRRFVLGGYVSTLLSCARLDGGDVDAPIDDMAEMMLRSVGVPADEAATIAHLPLPQLSPPTTRQEPA